MMLRACAVMMLAWAATAAPARAHFLWLVAGAEEGGKPTVRAFLSETPEPDLPEFLRAIAKAQIKAGGAVLGWSKDENTYRVDLPTDRPSFVEGTCDIGLMTKGDQTFRVAYSARVELEFGEQATPQEGLWLRLVARPGGKAAVEATFDGKPVAGVLVKVIPDEGEEVEIKTDEQGLIDRPDVVAGRAGLMAKHPDGKAGTHDGKPYGETRHYATFTVRPGAVLPNLPEAVTSLGVAVAGDHLYAYSGHTGKIHKYHAGTTAQRFTRLDLRQPAGWEDLPAGPALQGVTLTAHDGKLYRVGGMAAHNAAGAPQDLRSTAAVACYDPASGRWQDLPALPQARSTHDAAVLGDHLYVVGGWTLLGDSTTAEFCEPSLRLDLRSPGATWEELPPLPTLRRALAVAPFNGKIYALGGLTEEGKTTNVVEVFDPSSGAWSQGPDLPGEAKSWFAPGACVASDHLYVSGIKGDLLRLHPDGTAWEQAGRLAWPRLAHRLAADARGSIFAVGGNVAGAPTATVEATAGGRIRHK